MKTRILALALALLITSLQARSVDVEQAFARYGEALTPAQAALAAADILGAGAGFDDIHERLAAGSYLPVAPDTGRLLLEHRTADGTRHPFLVLVPDDYDSSRAYPLRVYLHGGVNRPARGSDCGWWRDPQRLAGDGHIAVFPYSWSDSLWWHSRQVENLAGILWRLKRTYNVDDNRVYLFGVSDGGTGAWFFAFRDTTSWAGFLPFIAHPAVLSSPGTGVAGELFPINLTNKPFYVVNGAQDRLYPTDAVEPYMTLFRDAGAELTFVSKPDSGHSTSWWPQEAEAIEAFVAAHARDPLPDRLAWRTDSVERYNRAHWVVIDEIGPDAGDLLEPNAVTIRGRSYLAFPRDGVSGQVEVQRSGNEIDVRTWGVRRYTLLLAPSEFDFDQPVVVHTNGVESFRGRVERSAAVLLKWAARDADRTLLFGAELSIEVEPR